MVKLIIAVIGSGALSALIAGIFTLISKRSDTKSAQAKCLLALAYDRTKWLCRKYIAEGSIDAEDLGDIIRMHEAYHDIGGNGYLDSLMAQVKKLPIRGE